MTPETLRKIDRLVLTRVLGYKPWKETRGGTVYIVWQTPTEREPWFKYRDGEKQHKQRYEPIGIEDIDDHNHIDCRSDQPRTSQSIAAAWEVVEKMGSWPMLTLQQVPAWTEGSTDRDAVWWKASYEKNGGLVWSASHESAPLAICLAALRAVGVDTTELEGR